MTCGKSTAVVRGMHPFGPCALCAAGQTNSHASVFTIRNLICASCISLQGPR